MNNHSQTNRKILLGSFLLITLYGSALFVFATPPTTPYRVSEAITDPACIPGGTNCFVAILESQDEGTNLTYQTDKLNFVGSGVTATEASGTVTVTIPGATVGQPVVSATANRILYTDASGNLANSDDLEFTSSSFEAQRTVTAGYTSRFALETFTVTGLGLSLPGTVMEHRNTAGDQIFSGVVTISSKPSFLAGYVKVDGTEYSAHTINDEGHNFSFVNATKDFSLDFEVAGLSFTNNSTGDTYAFPVDNGSTGQYLQTDGAGQLSWATVSGALSGLTAATATNTINNASYAQEWQWNTLTSNTGLALTSNSTTASTSTQKVLAVSTSGANANSGETTYAASFVNTHTGLISTNIAGSFSASGGTNNYALIVPAGSVGIGTATPLASTQATIFGSGSTSSTYGLQVHNSTGTNNALIVRDDASVGIGTATPGVAGGLHIYKSSASTIELLRLENPSNTGTEGGYIRMIAGSSTNVFDIYARRDRTDLSSTQDIHIGNTSVGYTGLLVDSATNNVVVGTSTPITSTKFGIRGGGATSSTSSFIVTNSTPSTIINIKDDGQMLLGLGATNTGSSLERNIVFGYEAKGKGDGAVGGGVSIGYRAGYSQSSGYPNVLIGQSAGYYNSTGASNVMIGTNVNAGTASATTVSNSVFIGSASNTVATASTVTGNDNVFIGFASGRNKTSGSGNTAIGHFSFYDTTTGSNNTGVGNYSGAGTTYSGTTALGLSMQPKANYEINIGSTSGALTFNNSVGASALGVYFNNIDQSFFVNANANIVLNKQTTLTSGTHYNAAATNTVTFANGTAPDGNVTDAVQLYSSDVTAGDAGLTIRTENGTQHIFGSKVGIAMIDPSVALDVTGDIEYTGTITDVSDERLKANITDFESGLSIINSIGVKNYNMINTPERQETGFIAQNVNSIFPQAVSIVDPANGYMGVSYVSFIPVLTKAIQELDLKITDLQSLDLTKPFSIASLIKSFLENVNNMIDTIFARRIKTQELCIDDVCITSSDLQNLINSGTVQNNGGSSGGETSAPIPEPEPAPEETNGEDVVEESPEEIVTEDDPEEIPEVETENIPEPPAEPVSEI